MAIKFHVIICEQNPWLGYARMPGNYVNINPRRNLYYLAMIEFWDVIIIILVHASVIIMIVASTGKPISHTRSTFNNDRDCCD